MTTIFLTGITTGLALIVAIGAQNAFILRQGIRNHATIGVVAICALSDVLLISLGVAGMGKLLASAQWAIEVMRWLGAAYLLWFAVQSLRSAFKPDSLDPDAATRPQRSPFWTALALTWLNPHVYLDTVIMLGGIANQYDSSRWVFAIGAMCASVVWFSSLGFGARFLAPYLDKPKVWRAIDVIIAIVMTAIAIQLIVFK